MPTESLKLAFTTQCLPGSVAEQQEQERIAEFQRNKALRLAEERRNQPELVAQREEAYQTAFEANQTRMRRDKFARSAPRGTILP